MKKTLYFVLLLNFCSSVNTLYAQQNAIKVNFLPGKFGLNYERAFSQHHSFIVEFQKWNLHNTQTKSSSLVGITETKNSYARITGYRFEGLARYYNKQVLNSGFFEGGIYIGKNDIQTTVTTTSTNPYYFLFLELDKVIESETIKKNYDSVIVGGIKLGGGYQKTFGFFDLELSGGVNFNAFNDHNARPTLDFKGISPYLRISMGIAI